IVDRQPTTRTIGTMILIAAAYMALVPATADTVMADILDTIGDGPSATLMAATALLLVPLTLLGTFSPIAVSLLTRSAGEAGRVAGLVYGVSTIGNVVGTLVTTFALIPTIGSRAITYYFAVILAGCAAILFIPFGKKTS
ncbi:fused MFS/spermidine synthase, partial [Bradyrhizobium sp.]